MGATKIRTSGVAAKDAVSRTERLLSLWQIVNLFKVADFAVLIERLTFVEEGSTAFSKVSSGSIISPELSSVLLDTANSARTFCQNVGFDDSATMAYILTLKMDPAGKRYAGPFNVSHLQSESRNLREALIREAWFRSFIIAKREDSLYLDNEGLFGVSVRISFRRHVSIFAKLVIVLRAAAILRLCSTSCERLNGACGRSV